MLKKELKLRLYQEQILNTCKNHNTIVVLPTGLGKTMIALALAVIQLKQHENSKVIFTAPTKPLVEQHKQLFSEYLKTEMFTATGKISPEEREKIYPATKIIFGTPQTLENDILTRKLNLENVSLMIFDEAHRASEGDYAYNFIAEQYARLSNYGRILGLTASPGHSKESVQIICKNLRIERVEIKSEDDETVKPYLKNKKIIPVIVELPKSFEEIKTHLEKTNKNLSERLSKTEVTEKKNIYKGDIIKLQAQLQQLIARGEANYQTFNAIKISAAMHKTLHSLELLQTEGINSLKDYFQKLKKQKSKSSQILFDIADFSFAYTKTFDTTEEHPKHEKLRNIIKQQDLSKSRILIFTKLRSTSKEIVNYLNQIKGVKAETFMGQKEGMTQKKQLAILENFKNGKYNVLCSTSVGEEGIHIPAVDIGIFFEPTSSALRTIQRTGRIGRTQVGRIYVLMTKGCIDERYYWISKHRQKAMYEELSELKNEDIGQATLNDF